MRLTCWRAWPTLGAPQVERVDSPAVDGLAVVPARKQPPEPGSLGGIGGTSWVRLKRRVEPSSVPWKADGHGPDLVARRQEIVVVPAEEPIPVLNTVGAEGRGSSRKVSSPVSLSWRGRPLLPERRGGRAWQNRSESGTSLSWMWEALDAGSGDEVPLPDPSPNEIVALRVRTTARSLPL